MRAWLPWAAALAVLVDVPLTLLVAPEAAGFNAPLTQRIFYYHVPAAWVAYLAFAVTAFAGAMLLWRRDERWDPIALASAEVGTLFSVIAMGTGLVWSRQEFVGYSPFRDAKVITLAVVIASYLAYLTLRGGIDEPERRQRLSAVFGILALLGVPLSYFASRASLHPDFTRPEETLDPALGYVLLASTLAFTLLYAAFAAMRYRLARLERHLEEHP